MPFFGKKEDKSVTGTNPGKPKYLEKSGQNGPKQSNPYATDQIQSAGTEYDPTVPFSHESSDDDISIQSNDSPQQFPKNSTQWDVLKTYKPKTHIGAVVEAGNAEKQDGETQAERLARLVQDDIEEQRRQRLRHIIDKLEEEGNDSSSSRSSSNPGSGTGLGLSQKEPVEQPLDVIAQLKTAEAQLEVFSLHQQRMKNWAEEENPSEEYLEEKERARLIKLSKERSRWFNISSSAIFHVTVLINFGFAWYDSIKLIFEEAKFQSLLLQDDWNCLEVIQKSDWLDHIVNIFHALMSACVLWSDSRKNAGLCIAFVLSQAVHTSFKSFQFFFNVRFQEEHILETFIVFLLFNVISDVLASVVVIQRFYDFTDTIRQRANYFSSNTVREACSLNDDIIYQNQSNFLQRKHILREAVASQTYTVIQKIEGYRRKGIPYDKVDLYKDLYAAQMALDDVDEVVNNKLMKALKKATARRLKQLDENPDLYKMKVAAAGENLLKVNLGVR